MMQSENKAVNNPSVKIIIATHKEYQMPVDNIYIPLHVGAEGKKNADGTELDLGYKKDNTGENISEKNSSYCELTGLYWAWKNLDADYIGLAHYRRHFGKKRKGEDWTESAITYEQLAPMLEQYKIFVPKKRKYYIETLYSHYKHTHYSSQLDIARGIIERMYPEYLDSYEAVVKHTYGYMFNMMIMKKEYLNQYCEWIFNILFELEKEIKSPELSAFQGRFYGRVSEILFNVWLDYELKSGKVSKQAVKEIPYFHVGKINWQRKITSFLKAKFLGKKYEGSF